MEGTVPKIAFSLDYEFFDKVQILAASSRAQKKRGTEFTEFSTRYVKQQIGSCLSALHISTVCFHENVGSQGCFSPNYFVMDNLSVPSIYQEVLECTRNVHSVVLTTYMTGLKKNV